MGTILDQLADYARVRVAKKKEQKPLEEIREAALKMAGPAKPGPGPINSKMTDGLLHGAGLR